MIKLVPDWMVNGISYVKKNAVSTHKKSRIKSIEIIEIIKYNLNSEKSFLTTL